MKTKLLIILNLIISAVYAQQSAVCIYKLIPDPARSKVKETDDVNTKYAYDIIEKGMAVAKELDYELKFNQTESSSQIIETMVSDGENKYLYPLAKASIGGGLFYQNKLLKNSLWQTNVMGEPYIVKDSIINDWEITSEHKKIGNYMCYKAVKKCSSCGGGLKEVWFTPEIPVPFGPIGYGGLPGLVISVVRHISSLQLVSIKFYNKPLLIDKPKKGKLIVRAEYDMITNQIRDNADKMHD